MKRSTAILAGAATVALAAGGMTASPAIADPIPVATSYADLLVPVPDAMERLAAADANQPAAHLELAQWNGQQNGNYHHHHHHHHHVYRNRGWYRANGYSWDGGRWVLRPRHHHHHHHHHHHDGY